jgi:hypothetical protein
VWIRSPGIVSSPTCQGLHICRTGVFFLRVFWSRLHACRVSVTCPSHVPLLGPLGRSRPLLCAVGGRHRCAVPRTHCMLAACSFGQPRRRLHVAAASRSCCRVLHLLSSTDLISHTFVSSPASSPLSSSLFVLSAYIFCLGLRSYILLGVVFVARARFTLFLLILFTCPSTSQRSYSYVFFCFL